MVHDASGERVASPARRIGFVAVVSGLAVIGVEGVGRRMPVPAAADCGKCSEYGNLPRNAALVGFPVLAFLTGIAVVAVALAVGRVARRWEVLAWLVPLSLGSVLLLRCLQGVVSAASTSDPTRFPLDDFWVVADAVGVAVCAAFLAAVTDDRVTGRRRAIGSGAEAEAAGGRDEPAAT